MKVTDAGLEFESDDEVIAAVKANIAGATEAVSAAVALEPQWGEAQARGIALELLAMARQLILAAETLLTSLNDDPPTAELAD